MKKIIVVNRHHIAYNKKRGGAEKPPFSVKTYKSNDYGHQIAIDGGCVFIYRPEKPLKCGATAWVETEGRVHLRDRAGNPKKVIP